MKRVLLTLTLVLFITPIVKAQDLPSYIPTDGLVAYYPFNGNANDESGNDHHGVVNEATLSDGLRGENTAYNFGSDSAYISVPSSSQLSLSNVDFTICALVKLDSYPLSQSDEDFNQYFTILGKRQYARTTRNYSIGISTPNSNIGGLKFTFAQGPRGVGSFVYSDLPVDTTGDWNNLVVVYTQNNSTIKFFVNSELVYQQDGIIIDGENDADLWFGKDVSGYANDFHGKIDDIGIWNRALTEQEIQNLYNSSSGDIILNGVVSAENHQIKNVADPTDAQDAVTKSFFESNRLLVPNKNIEQILSVGNDANGKQLKGLADPTDAQDAVTKSFIESLLSDYQSQIDNLQDQIDALQASSGSGTVTDQDGNSYPYLTYGNQAWTVENAEMVTYRDGTEIPQVTDAMEWQNLTTGAWAYYNNDPTKPRLYNWYAVMGIHDTDPNTPNKEFAPDGWHVPTDAEWTTLENYLIANGYNYDGTNTGNKIAKAMSSTTGWNGSTNSGAVGNDQSLNNSSGFNAFPEGNRFNLGSFDDEGNYAFFWSSTENSTNSAWTRDLYYNYSNLFRSEFLDKQSGFSVRFVRD